MKQLLLCFIAALLLMPSPLMADNAKKKNQDIGHNHGYAHRRHGPQRRRGARPEVGADSLRRPFQERRHFAHVNLLGRRVWREQR